MRRFQPRSLFAFVVPAIWTLFGVFAAGQLYLLVRSEGQALSFARALAIQLPTWWFWAALTPVVLAVGRRYRLDRQGWGRAVAVHLGVAGALATIHVAMVGLLNIWLALPGDRMPPLRTIVLNLLYSRLLLDLLVYAAIVGIGYAVDYHDRFRAREVDAARLEAELAQAELHALKMQLHPHFLFNTLNTIGILADENPGAAREMLTLLADLLRATLDQAGVQEVRLRQELELLESYLAIERMRFSDRLTVAFDVAPEVLDAWVPNLVLQPLVENAVRHGIAARSAPGRIVISARREDGNLRLSVTDDGPGMRATGGSRQDGGGLGLPTTRARLARLYGAAARLDLVPGFPAGTVASISVPYRAGAAPAA